MARLTVSYSIAFIPGLPRPLVLSEVIDDVLGLSTFSSRHSLRKAAGTPDRLDIIVPVEDLQAALDSAAHAADELTRIGESLLGLGFVVEERAIRIDGLTDNWLPDTFSGAGSRHHTSTHLDAAAPLPDHLEDPTGDVPDEDLYLDQLANSPAADQSFRSFTIADHFSPPPTKDDELLAADDESPFADPFATPGDASSGDVADPFARPGDEPSSDVANPLATPDGDRAEDRLRAVDDEELPGDPRGEDPFSVDPLGTRAMGGGPDGGGGARAALVAAPAHGPVLHREEAEAIVRRRLLVRQLAASSSAAATAPARVANRRAFGLFAVALVAAIAPWQLGVSTTATVALALVAAALVAGAVALWPAVRGFAARTAVTGTATLAVVLAFASAYAICAREGDLRGAAPGSRSPTVGQSLSAAVSLGAAPGLGLGPGARSVAYGERLLLLLALAGTGAQVARTNRRGR